MKNILYFHQSADLYGSDKVLLSLVSTIDKTQFRPIILLPRHGELCQALEEAEIEHYVVPLVIVGRKLFTPMGILRLPFIAWQSLRAVKKVLRGQHIHLVHSNTLAVLSGAIWARLHRVPHVWHVHEIIVNPKLVRKAYAWLLNWFADCIVCVSQATKENLLLDKPALSSKIQVVWNGMVRDSDVNDDEVRQYRSSVGIQDDEIFIVLVGRINRWKGQRELVKAAEILWQQGIRNLRFAIVGSVVPGQEYFLNSLHQAVDASPAKHCFVLQSYTRNIWSVWDACDIAVIPSTEPEPFGMVALEAMAAAKPIIAANHGGLAEIVAPGETGLLVPPGDTVALADALSRLAGDKKIRQQMGTAGLRRYRKEFVLDRYAGNMVRIYDHILNF